MLRPPLERASTAVAWKAGGVPGRLAARAHNVSESGLLLSVPEPVPVGAGVSLQVRPSGGSTLDLYGEVVRVVPSAGGEPGGYDVGVRVQGNGARTLLMVSRPGNA